VSSSSDPAAPERDCPLCPRLAAFRTAQRAAQSSWHNAPVPSFGKLDARLLIVGLAPGLKGANRTGRPFTGDYAGLLLYGTLIKFGFARGQYQERADDGLTLIDCRITNAVRCVPPANKPEIEEIRACGRFLAVEIAAMPRLAAVLALGQIAHQAVLAALNHKRARFPFGHGAVHKLSGDLILTDSYHCSRYNTNTGQLTGTMFDAVFTELRRHLISAQSSAAPTAT
jgi:uracil-DNA glycosylase family 4